MKKRDSTNSFSVHGTPEKDINLSKEVSDDLAKQAEDALDILASMKQSCESAICTLNDILLYDKIEAGTMALEKRPISAIQLLSQTIKPFYLQVDISNILIIIFFFEILTVNNVIRLDLMIFNLIYHKLLFSHLMDVFLKLILIKFLK